MSAPWAPWHSRLEAIFTYLQIPALIQDEATVQGKSMFEKNIHIYRINEFWNIWLIKQTLNKVLTWSGWECETRKRNEKTSDGKTPEVKSPISSLLAKKHYCKSLHCQHELPFLSFPLPTMPGVTPSSYLWTFISSLYCIPNASSIAVRKKVCFMSNALLYFLITRS